MYKQRKAPPYYYKNGVKHTTFNVRNVAGVYMIYKDEVLHYVGYSGNNLYRTMYRHFQDWSKSKQYRAIYNDKVLIRVIYTKTAEQAHNLETALIIKYAPAGNENQYFDFETEPKEDRALQDYLDTESSPIVEFKEEIPF
jgi:hypothetical protein